MSTLSDETIRDALHRGDLKVEPLLEPIQPASIDLRLSNLLRLPPDVGSHRIIDPASFVGEVFSTRMTFTRYLLKPGEFVVGSTLERVTLSNKLEAIVTGKSSLARIGLQIESAGYVDPQWDGNLTVEIKNLGPYYIYLTPGMTICQIRIGSILGPVSRGYGSAGLGSHYQGSEGPVSARFGQAGGPGLDISSPASSSSI